MNKKKLSELQQWTKEAEADEVLLAIRTCRLKKAYDQEKMKLVIALRGHAEQCRSSLLSALKQLGADVKQGEAPPSGLEKAIQSMLESWAV